MTAGSKVRSVRHRRLFDQTPLVRRIAAVAAVAATMLGSALPLDMAAATTGIGTAVARPAAATDTPALEVSLADAATIDLSGPVTLDLDWSTVSGIDPSTSFIRVRFSNGSLATADIDEWMAGRGVATDPVLETPLASVASGPVAAVGRIGSIVLPAEVTSTLAGRTLVGVRVDLVDDAATVVASASLVAATSAATNAAGSSLALVYPLVVPGIETGLISADDLATLTAPGGALDDTLDALIGQPVAIAIDPRIIASIRALGTAAPESALTWLRRLDSLPNVTFPLSYADADLAAQSQVKLDAPLEPLGFHDAIDPANFAPAITTTPPTVATPTTTPGAPAPAPSDAELVAWPYTRTDIAWPSDDVVTEADLGWFARSGLTKTILSNGNVAPAASPVSASATVGTSAAVVADGRITAALRNAVAATSHASWRQAMTRLEAELALAGASRDRLTLLATFARSDQPGRLGDTLRALSNVPTLERTTLTEALGTAPVARALAPAQVAPTRAASIDRMLRLEHDLSRFATTLTDPTALTAPLRRSLLALLSVGASAHANWADDAEAWVAAGSKTLHSVSVVPGSKVNVVSRESGVPTIVQNLSEFPVTVVIDVAPSNGRLIVEKSVTVTIDPGSRSNVLVPVAAGVGSGDVTLTISLTSPTGVPIGTPVDVDVNAQPDWEGITAAVLAVAVVLLFVVGVVRTIRRRRRVRVAAGEASDSADTNAAAEPPTRTSAEPGDP